MLIRVIVRAHWCIEEQRQRLSGAQPVSVTEVIFSVPAQRAILAALQQHSMEEGQGKQQARPGLGLLWMQG